MLFYSKANPNEAIPKTEDDQFDQIGMPRTFSERKMYVFCRTKEVFETAKEYVIIHVYLRNRNLNELIFYKVSMIISFF